MEIPAPVVTQRREPDPPDVAAPVPPPAPVAAPVTPPAPVAGPCLRPRPSRSPYVVAPGDCLWSIAAACSVRDADARAIDRGWRQIYAANRVAIGDDPNLIHIGLTLELPPLDAQP